MRGAFALSRECVRPCERFVRVGQNEIPQPMLFADRQRTPRVMQRRLRATEHGVHACDLPLADRPILRLAGPPPMKPRRVRRVDHLVVFGGGPHRALEKCPSVIEEIHGETAMRLHVGADRDGLSQEDLLAMPRC